MPKYHSLSIKNIVHETDQCVTLSFLVPEALEKDFIFKAGQYITLKATINGETIRRDYSLCSSADSELLKVAVKAVKNGIFSTYANTHLKRGDSLEVSLPHGRFIFEPSANKSRMIVAFAAGSGITPILSILKTGLNAEPNSTFVLVYGNKTVKDTMFLQELLDLKQKHGNRFSIQFLYSQAQEENALFGRIEKSTVNLIVNNRYKETAIDSFYICGPELMIKTVKSVLIDNNVADNNIHFELFTASVTPQNNDSNTLVKGFSKVTVLIDDQEETFEMPQNQTLLDAAIEKDLDAPYSCQGGVCSSCIARITEGTAIMRQNNILTDNEVAEGLVLTCQAEPTSQIIKVNYDDV